MSSLGKLLDFLNKLDEYGFDYSLEHNAEETLTVLVGVPGERWEVEFFSDGHVEVEVFYSGTEDDQLEGEEALDRLFAEHEDYLEEDEDDFDFEEDDEDEDDLDDGDLDEDDGDYDYDEDEDEDEDEEMDRRG